MSLPLNQVITGDCTEIMRTWPSDSIDLVVTSPPYWGLRDYGSETVRVWGGLLECEHTWGNELIQKTRGAARGSTAQVGNQLREIQGTEVKQGNFCVSCGAWRGSLGLEPHPQLFIDHLVEICREIRRVLKPSGTFWLNLGDTYCGSWGNYGARRGEQRPQNVEKFDRKGQTPQTLRVPQSYTDKSGWLQPKQKLMMPARVAIALQHDGWILRNDIIWHKPNHMPSSVKDRLTTAYEHVFLFAKARRYYFDLDAIRQPHQGIASGNKERKYLADPRQFGKEHYGRSIPWEPTDKGKNPGDVWDIEEKNLTKHDRSVGRINRSYTDSLHKKGYALKGKNPGDVLSGSKYLEQDHPHSIRVKGGHTGDYTHPRGKNPGDLWRIPTTPFPGAHFATFPPKLITPIIKAGSPKGGIVLDPFGGSGTVGQVARRLGRRFILIEIIPGYCKMAEQRVRGRYKPIPSEIVPLDQFMEAEK